MYRAVIADFDGTLLNSFEEGVGRIEGLVTKYGIKLTPEIRSRMMHRWGHSGGDFVEYAFGIPAREAAAIYAEWEQLDLDTPMSFIAGTESTLQWLTSTGRVVCLLTSRYRDTAVSLLELEGLSGYFAHIYGREDTKHHKPDPRAFDDVLAMLAKHGVPPQQCLFVGDTKVDIEAGHGAGLTTIVVETGPYRHEHYKTHPVDEEYVIPSIAHLPRWIMGA